MVRFQIDRAAVDKTELREKVLHDDIIAVGIHAQAAALPECPVDAERSDSLF